MKCNIQSFNYSCIIEYVTKAKLSLDIYIYKDKK